MYAKQFLSSQIHGQLCIVYGDTVMNRLDNGITISQVAAQIRKMMRGVVSRLMKLFKQMDQNL